MDNGAKRSLIPIEYKRQFLEVDPDVLEKVDPFLRRSAAGGVQGVRAELTTSTGASVQVRLPPYWFWSDAFESVMDQSNPHTLSHGDVEFIVPAGCKVPIQTALMLTSLLNQLACCGRRVVLSFESTEGAYGYLSRMRFFESLAPEVEVRPERPAVTGAMIHGGGNPSLVEIHEIPPASPQSASHLPALLAASLRQSLQGRPDADRIEGHIGTVLTEVLDNVYQHSHTPIAGFVGLQPYRHGANVVLAVSDSGHGLSTTIRNAIPGKLHRLTESDLVVKVFREGLSRLGEGTGRGGGLRRSAVIAIQYGATLYVRLPSAIVRLVPAGREYDKNVAHCRDDAPLLWGTHIHFEFRLTS